MNREIFRIAVPNIISNITVPLMGIASMFIAGHIGNSTHTIGMLAIGVSIFNFIYWNCSFIRMGTSGLTAQAFGAGNYQETSNMLARAVAVSLLVGVAVLVLQYPLGELSLMIMNGDESVSDYFYARIWAVPAGIMLFGLNGWFTGMQNAVIPMCTSIVVNVVHVLCSLWFALGLGMGIVGIAYASVVAQWTGLLVSAVLLFAVFGKTLRKVDLHEVIDMRPMREFFRVNADIIVRTFFTAASSHMGDSVILAVNAMLMQLFTLFSYMNDGFAYAAEALTGRFVGARDVVSLRRCIKRCFAWTLVTALVSIGIYVGWWQEILSFFMSRDTADAEAILATAHRYIGWGMAIPLAAAIPFTMDGMMVGATLTKIMRNSMLLSTAAYFAIYYGLRGVMGNDALWLAFTSYMVIRGVLQFFMSHRMHDLFARAGK